MTTVGAILGSPDTYVGRTTTVDGTVGQMVGQQGLILQEPSIPSEQLLVASMLSPRGTYADGTTPARGSGSGLPAK